MQICLDTTEKFQKYEIISTIVSVPTSQSLDDTSIIAPCKSHRSIIVYEEHSIHGSLEQQ